MGNRSGLPPDEPRRGDAIEASAISAIIRQLTGRIVGIEPVKVKQAGDNVTIAVDQDGLENAVVDRIFAKITSETGSGVYAWTKVRGAGPPTGSVTEFDLTTGIAVNTKIWIFKIQNAWWFKVPATQTSCGLSYGSSSTLGSRQSLSFSSFLFDNGGFNQSGAAKIPADGDYLLAATVAFYGPGGTIFGHNTGSVIATVGGVDHMVSSGHVVDLLLWGDAFGSDVFGVWRVVRSGTVPITATKGQVIGLDASAAGPDKASLAAASGSITLVKV